MNKRPPGLLLIGLDHFKACDDHRGRRAGDLCLANVAQFVAQRGARRPLDLVGGEEFAVLLYDARRSRKSGAPASPWTPFVTLSTGAPAFHSCLAVTLKASSSSGMKRFSASAIIRSSWIAGTTPSRRARFGFVGEMSHEAWRKPRCSRRL
jgi:GGDEF domain-containing protein